MGKTTGIIAGIVLLGLVFWGVYQWINRPAAIPEKPFVSEVVHPEWTKNAVLYELNIRQFSEEGTFKGVLPHLTRLKKLGVDILWFMPLHPIGEENRKGEMGSYYSVKDYREVNPEFGTMDDFRELVDSARNMGFHVIMDWVPNHTAWDNPLLEEHPEWYARDSAGNFISPYDWTDVVQLDWSHPELQDYMLESLKFWVELGVEGFRVDHPHKTPYDFWEKARAELEKIRPVFLLAENEDQTRFLEKAFDMNYSWELHHLMNDLAQGKDSVKSIDRYFQREQEVYPPDVYRMRFIDNHDENSWAGTVEERLGEAHEAFAVLMFTIPGMPLLYNGQEACLDKRLKFFTRDPIEWKECDKTEFYQSLIRLKKENKVLWNGSWGGVMERISTGRDRKVFAFTREKEGNRVIVFLNLSRNPLSVLPDLSGISGECREAFTGKRTGFPLTDSLRLKAWDYRVFVNSDNDDSDEF